MILNSFMMECYTRINYLYDRFVQSYTKIIQDLKDIDLVSLLTAKLAVIIVILKLPLSNHPSDCRCQET
jgi:hypothetical protein